ncbi:MAG: cyclic nucleotide-binding domain-containing protein [Candidatus Latescibacteria bacterium]|nr:cyclic nucleotide-binding domain-containing protein [Candidatus Latescibacterota bacterium]
MTNKAPSAKAQEQVLLQKLLHVPVFNRLPTPYLQLLLRAAKPRALAEGAAVWNPGEPSKGLYILLKGQLKIVAEGKYDHPVQPIAALGEVNALTRLPYGDQAVAVESSVLLEVGQEGFEQLLLANTNVCQLLCRNILNVISEKLQAANDRISQAEGDRQGLAQRIKDAEADVNALRIIKLR